jgi:hypothetical protein
MIITEPNKFVAEVHASRALRLLCGKYENDTVSAHKNEQKKN